MTTEKTDEQKSNEETSESFGCCCPPQFKEMMASFAEGDKGDCFAKMQEMMKGGCCSAEEK